MIIWDHIMLSNEKLCQKCYSGNLEEVKKVVEQESADVNYKKGEPLIYTIKGEGDVKAKQGIIEYLKSHGADISIRDGVALTWAVMVESFELVQFLFGQGMSMNQDGGLPVFHAAQRQNPEIFSYLLRNGAQIDEDMRNEICKLICMQEEHSKIKEIYDAYQLTLDS
jgi:hypothetical protein